MSIGTPVQLGAGSAASGFTAAITTLADSPAGNLIVVLAGGIGGAAISSVTDGTNTYVSTNVVTTANGRVQIWYCENAAHLAVSATITVTFGSSPGSKLACAVSVSGIRSSGSLDANGSGTSGSGTSLSTSTGVLVNANEIVFGATVVDSDPSTWTEASGFTSNTDANQTFRLRSGYRIVTATTSVGYAPSWVTSRNFEANVVSFQGSSTVSAAQGSFTETGKAAAFLYNRAVVAARGSFVLTGEPATRLGTFILRATDYGSYALTGKDASLLGFWRTVDSLSETWVSVTPTDETWT